MGCFRQHRTPLQARERNSCFHSLIQNRIRNQRETPRNSILPPTSLHATYSTLSNGEFIFTRRTQIVISEFEGRSLFDWLSRFVDRRQRVLFSSPAHTENHAAAVFDVDFKFLHLISTCSSQGVPLILLNMRACFSTSHHCSQKRPSREVNGKRTIPIQ